MIIYILIGCIFFILVVIIIYIYYYNYYYKKIILDPHNKNNEEYLHTLNEKKPPTEEEIMFNEIKDGLKDLIKTIALFKELDLTFSDLNNIINDSYIAINLYNSIDNIVYHFKGNNIKDEYRNNINKAILKHLQKQIQTTLPIDIITTASSSSTSDTIVVSTDIYNAISKNTDSTINNIDNISPEKYEDKIKDLLDNSNALKTKIMIDLNTLINADANNIEIYNAILNYKLNIDLQERTPPIFTIANMDQFNLYNKYIDIRNIITSEINNISNDNINNLQSAISSLNNALKINTNDMVKNMVKNILSINIDNEPLSILQVYDKLKTNFVAANIIDEINKINSIKTIISSTELLNLITIFNEKQLTKTLLNNTINSLKLKSGISLLFDTTSPLDILEIYNKLIKNDYTIDKDSLPNLIKIINITIRKKSIKSISSDINITILKYTIMKELHYIDNISGIIDNLVGELVSIESSKSILDNLLYNNYINIESIIADINNAITKALSILKLESFAIKYDLLGINTNNIFANIRLFFTTIIEYNLTNIDNVDILALLLTNIRLQDFNTKSISDNFYNNITTIINDELINKINIINISNDELINIINAINNNIRQEGENYISIPNSYGNIIIKSRGTQHIINFNTADGVYQPVAYTIDSEYQMGPVDKYKSPKLIKNADNRSDHDHITNITKIYNLQFIIQEHYEYDAYVEAFKTPRVNTKIASASVNITFKHDSKTIREYNFNIIDDGSINPFYNIRGPIFYDKTNLRLINPRGHTWESVPLFLFIYTINFEQPIIIYKNNITITITITNNSYSYNIRFLNFDTYDIKYGTPIISTNNYINFTFN